MNFNRRKFLRAAGMGAVAIGTPALLAQTPSRATTPLPGANDFPGASNATPPAAPPAAPIVQRTPLMQRAYDALEAHGPQIARRDVMGVVDFNAHSATKRFEIVDIASGDVLQSYLVAHGKGSDPAHSGFLTKFSNVEGSNATSRGAYLVSNTYIGKYGRSRRLIGLEPDNYLALDRAIVMHGADYVSPGMVSQHGKIGRSFGCFSVERHLITEVMDLLPEGCLLFADQV